MRYGLREGIGFCVAGDQFFFLDRLANRYFALRSADQRYFRALLEAQGEIGAHEALPPALARLACARSPGPLTPFALKAMPDCDLDSCEGGPVRPLLLAWAAWSLAAMKHHRARMKRAGVFDGNVPAICWPRALRPDRVPLVDLTRVFERVRSWTGEDQCLPLSLAYAGMARAMGYRVEIVFGVTPRPFGAHCWVQQGSTVLNDRLARVETFTPIYAS